MTRRWAASLAAAVVVLAGCSGDDGDADEQVDPAATSASLVSVTDNTAAVDIGGTSQPDEPASTTVATTSPTTTVAEGVVPGTAAIALLTEGSGLGARPLLRWEAVAAAATYVVSVNAPTGGPVWAWQGSVNEVPFGGGPAGDPDTTGAQLVGPATWFVAALDANGLVIATSARADLAP